MAGVMTSAADMLLSEAFAELAGRMTVMVLSSLRYFWNTSRMPGEEKRQVSKSVETYIDL
jgi:hypothetical protein